MSRTGYAHLATPQGYKEHLFLLFENRPFKTTVSIENKKHSFIKCVFLVFFVLKKHKTIFENTNQTNLIIYGFP